MRNQRFENKKSQKNYFSDAEENNIKKQRHNDHKLHKNWKNRLMQDEEDEDEDFFHFDEDEE